MTSLNFTIKKSKHSRKILVEIDADRLERLASALGFFSSEFLKSLQRAEKDYKAHRIKKIKSLREPRKDK